MNKLKMSLENIQGKLSRVEMRNIMAGCGSTPCGYTCSQSSDCGSNCQSCASTKIGKYCAQTILG